MSKPLGIILLAVIGVLVLWRGTTAILGIWEHARLNLETPAQSVKWQLVPKGSKFALQASYTYSYKGKNFNNKSFLPKPYYLNRQTAEREIQKMNGMEWNIWIDSDHPEYSSLQKVFPFRETAYAICLLGIFLYFTYIKFYLEVFSKRI